MKLKFLKLMLVLLAFQELSWSQETQMKERSDSSLRLMSFNIRNGRAKDGDNKWENRKDFVCDVIRDQAPDVVGLQEAFHFQLEYLKKKLPKFESVGVGRDGGQNGEYSAILYRQDRFTVKDSGTFWLSDTPEKKSRGWGNRYFRICTWAYFTAKKTGRSFYVYNTHFDHQSQNARYRSAELVADRISKRIHKAPYVFMGDLNAGETNDVVLYLKGEKVKGESAKSPVKMVDTFRVLYPKVQTVGTGGGFLGRKNGPKIDYILVGRTTKTLEASIIRTNRDNKYPSDHFPVFAQIELPALNSK